MAKEVRIYVKAVRRERPDLRKLARVLIQLALTQQADGGDQARTDVLPPAEKDS